MPNASRSSLAGLAAAAALTLAPAQAAEPARENLVSFSTSAQIEVTKDLLGITLQAVRDGNDSATVQAQLKQVLDAALTEARKAAAPGAMEVRTGGFSLFPRYGKDGKINGWQGQAELVLEGKDSQRVAQTAGKLTAMNVTSVGYSISRELAEKHEAEVTAQAIQRYRAKALEYAKQFGYTGYELREVTVQTGAQSNAPRLAPASFQAKAQMSVASDATVPIEPGKGLVDATVSGIVKLTK